MAATNSKEVTEEGADKVSAVTLNAIMGSINGLGVKMEENFKALRAFKCALKEDLDKLKTTVVDLEKAWTGLAQQVSELEEKNTLYKTKLSQQQAEINDLKKQLDAEKERVLHLEEYSRRENLKFRNIPELPEENSKDLLLDIISNDLGLEVGQMRFHAVHRVGKPRKGKPRAIIARFVCREDKDLVYSQRNLLKESVRFEDAYITLDYPAAVQEERAILIKAMLKARANGANAKVIGRNLFIENTKYDISNVPQDLKD